MIRKTTKGYNVVGHQKKAGRRKLFGTYKTKTAAQKRLGQIKGRGYFRKKKG